MRLAAVVRIVALATPLLTMPIAGMAASAEDQAILQNPDASRQSYEAGSVPPRYRLAAGISYTGFQVRYHLTGRWAAEGRFQFGKADSNYGDVKSNVEGIRLYRFLPYRPKLSWYLGGEAAHASAEAQESSYKTDGFALGVFGGMEYRVLKRVSVGVDIGPYAIALKEQQTGQSQSSLDFVVNTALNFYIF
jgi:hypothetical protein